MLTFTDGYRERLGTPRTIAAGMQVAANGFQDLGVILADVGLEQG